MPEEFFNAKSDPYAKFSHHIPIYAHPYKEAIVAGDPKAPEFTITFSAGQRIITIGNQSHTLIGSVSRCDPMVLAYHGPAQIPTIIRTEASTPDINLTIENVTYLATRKDNHAILIAANNDELARITPAWKDSDTDKGIKFWIHSHQAIPPLVNAIFFSIGLTYDQATQYGIVISY